MFLLPFFCLFVNEGKKIFTTTTPLRISAVNNLMFYFPMHYIFFNEINTSAMHQGITGRDINRKRLFNEIYINHQLIDRSHHTENNSISTYKTTICCYSKPILLFFTLSLFVLTQRRR